MQSADLCCSLGASSLTEKQRTLVLPVIHGENSAARYNIASFGLQEDSALVKCGSQHIKKHMFLYAFKAFPDYLL